MLEIKLLGSLIILVVVSTFNHHQALATSYIQPQIDFEASLEQHETSAPVLQRVCLRCGSKRGTALENDLLSPLLRGGQRKVPAQHSKSATLSGQYYIVVMDESNETNLTNYTSSVHENGNITVTFYIPRQTKFVSKFSCGYNISNLTTNLTNITTDLVFAYVPIENHLDADTTFRYLFSFFCCFFVITLVLLVAVCVCYCRQLRKMACLQQRSISMDTGKERSGESHHPARRGTYSTTRSKTNGKIELLDSSASYSCDHNVPFQVVLNSFCPDHENSVRKLEDAPFSFKTLPALSGEPLSEAAVDDFLKILSHPSPCLSRGCPCSYYKRKLLCNLRSSVLQTPAQRSYLSSATSDLGIELSMSLLGDLAEVDPGYSSVTSQQPSFRCLESMAEIDHGYASVSSQRYNPQEKEAEIHLPQHSAINPQPAVKVEGFFQPQPDQKVDTNQELLFVTPPPAVVVEIEMSQGSSSEVDYHGSDNSKCDITTSSACLADTSNHSPTLSPRLLGGAVSPAHRHLSSSASASDYHGISYPILYPDIRDEVLELSNKFDLNMKFIDPIETVQFDCNGGRYANENHEVYLRIPRGAIPEGKTISIEVGLSFHSTLVSLLPLETRPVSPLLKLCVLGEPNFRFLKPVEVTLPHFLDIADQEDPIRMGLQFLKSGHSLYCFHKSDGVAKFKPRTNTATLKTAHFCTFCITANENISNKKVNYRLVKVVPKNREQKEWRANFCVTYYLRTCLQALKKQFPDREYEMKTLRKFKFGESDQLEIHFERKLAGGWQMALENNSKINPEAVKYWDLDPDELEMMEDEMVYPPRFEVLVCGSHARELITALICFRGMAAEVGSDTTELMLEPMAAGLLATAAPIGAMMRPPYHMDHRLGLSQSRSSPAISQYPRLFPYHCPYEGASEVSSKRSSTHSFSSGPAYSDLMNFVAATLPTKWRLVGVQLGLSLTSLDEIGRNHSDDCKRCFSVVFREWEHQNTSPYCWATVIHALQAPSVEENRVAEDVRAHCMHDTWSLCSTQSSTGSSSGYCTETVTHV